MSFTLLKQGSVHVPHAVPRGVKTRGQWHVGVKRTRFVNEVQDWSHYQYRGCEASPGLIFGMLMHLERSFLSS